MSKKVTLLCGGLICAVLGPRAVAQGGPEPRRMTLSQVVEVALRQNPDYLLTRLDERKAQEVVHEARGPFIPRLVIGSGLAYTNGFPLSIEGSAPSIVQAQTTQFLYNRTQKFRVREAREMAGAAGHSTASKADEIAFRVASTYLDFDRAVRAAAAAEGQVATAERLERLVEDRVQAGREIPLELNRARLATARVRARLTDLRAHASLLEETLRSDLALGDDLRIVPVETELPAAAARPATEDAAVETSLAASKEVKRLESLVQARRYGVEAERGGRYPRIDLVGQYALFSKFNNYEDYFRSFKRNNGQIGMSIQFPVFPGGETGPRVAQAEADVERARLELTAARSNISLETRRLYQQIRQADSARELARMELDLARESLSVLLARFDSGRVGLTEVEQARAEEAQRWEAYYDARTAADKAQLNLLRQTGELLSALR
jgi:outer membrane protein